VKTTGGTNPGLPDALPMKGPLFAKLVGVSPLNCCHRQPARASSCSLIVIDGIDLNSPATIEAAASKPWCALTAHCEAAAPFCPQVLTAGALPTTSWWDCPVKRWGIIAAQRSAQPGNRSWTMRTFPHRLVGVSHG